MVTIFVLLLSSVGLLYYYLTKNYGTWKKRGIEGPEPSLLVGNFPSIYNKSRHIAHEMKAIYKKYKGRVPFVGTFNGVVPYLLILDPELIKKCLITNFSNFSTQGFIPDYDETHDPLFGRNPFFLKGEQWKNKRNEIIPAFSTGRIKALWPIMTEVSERMKNYLIQHQSKTFIEARELCEKYTTDVVAASIHGVEGGSFTNKDSEIRRIAHDVMSPNWRTILITLLQPAFPIISKIFKIRFVPKKEADFLVDLLNRTLEYRKKNNVDRIDFVDYLAHLKEKKGLPDIEIAAHTLTFFFDGIETSSITLSYVLYELAKNQRVQDKLREQLVEIRKKGPFTYEDVYEHKYLDQIVHETMRLNIVVSFMAKKCSEGIELTSSEGQRIKFRKGDLVSFPVREIQRDPEYYDQAEDFIPERFDEEKGGTKIYRDKMVFMPFGEGPRICVGQRFAMAQMKCAIANLVANFKLTVSDEMPKNPEFNPMDIMIVYKSGIRLNFEPLEQSF